MHLADQKKLFTVKKSLEEGAEIFEGSNYMYRIQILRGDFVVEGYTDCLDLGISLLRRAGLSPLASRLLKVR